MLSLSQTVTASGDTTLLAAPASGFWTVIGYQITSQTSVNEVQLKCGSDIKARINSTVSAGGGISCPTSDEPYFDCLSSGVPGALVANLSGSGTVDINIQYANK